MESHKFKVLETRDFISNYREVDKISFRFRLGFYASMGPRASTKVESYASFTESQKVSKLTFCICLFFCNVEH